MSQQVKVNLSLIVAIVSLATTLLGFGFGGGALYTTANHNSQRIQELDETLNNKLDSITERIDRVIEQTK